MQHIHPSDFERLMASEEAAALSAAARERLNWIAYVVRQRCSISEACVHLGISRSSLHRWLERFDPADLTSLEEKSHEPHAMRASTVPQHITSLIRGYREREPLMGKERIRELLLAEHSIDLSSSTIGRVIERECLYFAQTPLHWRKRMHAKPQNVPAMQPVMAPITQQTIPAAPMPMSMHEADAKNDEDHDCLMCTFKRADKRPWKRALILTSILTNVAVAALFIATTIWEAKNPPPLPAQTLQTITETTSTLDN